MEITWGALLFASLAGFLVATLCAVLVGFWLRGMVKAHAETIEDENKQLREAVLAYEEAFKKMRATPPSK